MLTSILAIHIAEGLNPSVIKVRLRILRTIIPMFLRPARPSQHVVPAAPSTPLKMKWINITYTFSSYLTDSRVFSLKLPVGEYCIGKRSFKTASYFRCNTIKQIKLGYSHCLLWEPHGACRLYKHIKPYVLLLNLMLCVLTTYNKSLVRFQMVSLEFFIDIILPIALWPWGRLNL
jgi:hypothetical protein